MVAFARSQSLTGAIAPLGGALAGLAAVAAFGLMPAESLEALAWNSGVATLIPAAQPPLGTTARAILALGGGIVAAAVAWSALFLLFGPGGFLSPRTRGAGVPSIRRADAHPDCPPRPPMTAADLGTPMMEINAAPSTSRKARRAVERPLPADLDQPLSAFDPAALPSTPREPVRPVPSLAPASVSALSSGRQPLAPGERLETFALEPAPEPALPPQRREPASQQTIEALLRRLEESAGRRPRPESGAA